MAKEVMLQALEMCDRAMANAQRLSAIMRKEGYVTTAGRRYDDDFALANKVRKQIRQALEELEKDK